MKLIHSQYMFLSQKGKKQESIKEQEIFYPDWFKLRITNLHPQADYCVLMYDILLYQLSLTICPHRPRINAPALATLQVCRFVHLELHWLQGAHISDSNCPHRQTGNKARDQKSLFIHTLFIYHWEGGWALEETPQSRGYCTKLCWSSRWVWTTLSDVGFEFWMVMCGASSCSWWFW